MRKLLFNALFTALFLAPWVARAAIDPAVEKRLQELERVAEENEVARFGSERGVRSYLRTKLNLGGFSETAITSIFQRDHGAQAVVSSSILGLTVGAEFSDDFHFNSQILSGISIPVANPHDDPSAPSAGAPFRREYGAYTVGTVITQAFLEWERSDSFRVQAGIGYAPFAITFQQFDLVLLVRRGGPQMLRANNELVHLLWQGLHLHGQFSGISTRWGYNLYTFSPSTHTQMLGVGSRLWLDLFRRMISLGLSSQTASRGATTYTTAGADLRYRMGRFTLTSELAKSYGAGAQPWSVHVEPDFDIYRQAFLIYAFADYLESKTNRTGNSAALPDPFRKWEYGAGVNWLPTAFTRLRFGGAYNHYVGSYARNAGGRDHWLWDLSAGVAF